MGSRRSLGRAARWRQVNHRAISHDRRPPSPLRFRQPRLEILDLLPVSLNQHICTFDLNLLCVQRFKAQHVSQSVRNYMERRENKLERRTLTPLKLHIKPDIFGLSSQRAEIRVQGGHHIIRALPDRDGCSSFGGMWSLGKVTENQHSDRTGRGAITHPSLSRFVVPWAPR